jgi:methylated-DNA-protein-cysteine methyltransferase related protein
MGDRLYERIYRIVQRIPPGRVATYGQVAMIADLPHGARLVGYSLAALGRGRPRPLVPWHRVVNVHGRSSQGEEQVNRLQAEGVVFEESGCIDLHRFGWDGAEDA